LNYLDRSTSHWVENAEALITKREFQLLAVTSLYMAIKVHGETDNSEGPRRKLKIDAFYELSRKQFDVALIESTERHILTALNWNVNPPTALKFIATFLSLCPQWEYSVHHAPHATVIAGIYDVARYLSELSVCQSGFGFTCKPSVIAFSSIIFAIDKLHATLPLPYSVRVAFLNNIALATGLVSGNVDVLRACEMLLSIWPGMVPADEMAHEYQSDRASDGGDDLSVDGKVSPVCVMAEQQQCQTSPRKRSRSIDGNAVQTPVDVECHPKL
jgi:Cyclin, N-terminal domain